MPGEADLPGAVLGTVGVIFHGDHLGFALGIVGNGELHRLQHRHDPLGSLVQVFPQAEFQKCVGNGVGRLGHAHPLAEVADGLGGIAPAAQAAEGGHPGVIPAGNIAVLHQRSQLPLAEHGVVDAQSRELDLPGMMRHGDMLHHPVIKRTVVLKFQRAQRMGNALQRVLNGVCKVVHGIDAPLVSLTVVVHMTDAIDDRVAHIEVAGSQIDLGAEGITVVLKFSGAHSGEQVQTFLNGAVAVRGNGRGIQVAPVLLELLRRQLADVGQPLLDQLHRIFVVLLKIVGAVVEAVAPVEAQPVDVLLDGFHELHILFGGVGVVHAEVAQAIVLLGGAEVDDQRLAVADMQIAVGFRRKPGMDGLTRKLPAGGDVLVDECVDKVFAFSHFSHDNPSHFLGFFQLQDIIPYCFQFCNQKSRQNPSFPRGALCGNYTEGPAL